MSSDEFVIRHSVGLQLKLTDATRAQSAKSTIGRRVARQAFSFLRIAVALGLLYLLLSKVDLRGAWDTMRTANLLWLLAAVFCFFMFLFISNWRWKVLLDARGLKLSFGYLLKVYFVAWMLNNVLPTSIGGDVARIAYTARGDRKALAFAATLVDRIVGFIGLFFFALVISVILWFVTRTSWYLVLNLVGFVGLVLIALTLFSDTMHRVVVAVFGRIKFMRLGEKIDEVYCAVKEFRTARAALFLSFLTSLLLQLTLALTWFCTARSVGGEVILLYYCLLIPIIGIMTMIPVTVGGLGVRENSFKAFFTAERMAHHLSAEQAIATALLYLVITIIFALAGAVVLVFLKRGAVPVSTEPVRACPPDQTSSPLPQQSTL